MAGTFTDTFAAIHPEQVRTLSSGMNTIAFLPFAEVTDDTPIYDEVGQTEVYWPGGTADLAEFDIEGVTAFNREA